MWLVLCYILFCIFVITSTINSHHIFFVNYFTVFNNQSYYVYRTGLDYFYFFFIFCIPSTWFVRFSPITFPVFTHFDASLHLILYLLMIFV